MKKPDAIHGLIASGLQEFCRQGFEGASLRGIATRAGVPLSTIHRYFGNKSELFRAVEQSVWDEINVERDIRLAAALRDQPPRIEAIMRALIEPVVLRALGDDEGGRNTVEMLRSATIARRQLGENGGPRGYASISERWFAAIRAALPDLPGDMLVWAFSFAVGAMYSWQLIDHFYERMLPHERELPAGEVTDMLVAFCAAGFKAIEQSADAAPRGTIVSLS